MIEPASRRASIASAIAMIACADSDSGCAATIGTPASPCSRRSGSSGTSPRSGTSSSRGERGAASGAEHVAAHVLDHAEQAHVGLARHGRGARGDVLCKLLRRRHDDHLCTREQLAERDGDVARAGGHVHDEHVDVAPVNVGEELLERTMEHRAAPHHRLVAVEEEADRHELQAVLDRWDDHLVDRDRLLVDVQDVRDRVPVDVGVEDADALAQLRERDAEVRGERGLADPALAGGDRDDAAVARKTDDVVALGGAAAELRRERLTLLGRHDAEAERRSRGRRARLRAPARPAARRSRAAGSRRW